MSLALSRLSWHFAKGFPMSGGPMGNTQQSYGPQSVGGASYNNSASQQRWQPQGYAQQPYQGYQNYGQQQMPPWVGSLMSMFQRPGMGYQGGQQWSNPYWQPRPVQMPQQAPQQTIGGAPVSGVPTLAQQYQEAMQTINKAKEAQQPLQPYGYGDSSGTL